MTISVIKRKDLCGFCVVALENINMSKSVEIGVSVNSAMRCGSEVSLIDVFAGLRFGCITGRSSSPRHTAQGIDEIL